MTTLLVALLYPVLIQITSKLCGHSINGFMAFWLAASVIGFFMGDCRKSLMKTRFYQIYCNKGQLRSYVSPEDYSRGIVMTAIQSFIYSIPLLAMGFFTQFNDNELNFFWGLMLILATIYGNLGAWHSSRDWEMATWKQFWLTCWIPLPMLCVVMLWLTIFDVEVMSAIAIVMANMVSSILSVLAISHLKSLIGRG